MGRALEIISGRATAPGATLTALTMASGNSLTVRNATQNSDVRMLSMWAFNNAAGVFRIKSPNIHDNVQGIRYRIPASDPNNLIPEGFSQKLIPQDTLIGEISGSAVGGQIEQGQALIWYGDLPGADSRLANWSDIVSRVVNIEVQEVAITPGATGGYSGTVAMNTTFDNLKANTDYALLGGMVDVVCAAVRISGPDTSNFGVGFPGILSDRMVSGRWFKILNEKLGIPTIPIISSANKFGTNVDIVQSQTGNAVNVSLIMAQLR